MSRSNTIITFIVGILVILFAILFVLYKVFFAPVGGTASSVIFSIPINVNSSQIPAELKSKGYIKSTLGFDVAIALHGGMKSITPGGYSIAPNMSAFTIARVLSHKPAMQWVVIPEGVRKEEIGEIVAKKIGWTPAQLQDWDTSATNQAANNFEGVYFPSTYLIANTATPEDVAKELIAQFDTQFAPYAKEAIAQNIKWTTALKIASLVQREAAGPSDMPLVAGIIWNRLLKNMKLQIDATVQYARGNTGAGWWAPVTHADLSIQSPYNTYLYTGLPPHPIDDPGIDAINAVLNPATTTCMYYLHDANGVIHCSDTYAGQQANIKQYLQ